jgi:hypothetical protein
MSFFEIILVVGAGVLLVGICMYAGAAKAVHDHNKEQDR